MTAPVILYAEFTARPGCADRVAASITGFATDVRAEPGCLEFAVYREQDDPNRFFVFERYVDADAFAAHLGAAHSGPFNAVLVELIEEPASVLTRLDPVDGA